MFKSKAFDMQAEKKLSLVTMEQGTQMFYSFTVNDDYA
jgi:hypothetical protein